MNVNLEPKQKFEKTFVEPDAYVATVVEISDIKQEKGFPKKNEQGILEQKMVDKFHINPELINHLLFKNSLLILFGKSFLLLDVRYFYHCRNVCIWFDKTLFKFLFWF